MSIPIHKAVMYIDHSYTVAIVCPPLTAPDNGTISCSLGGDGEANLGDNCTFTCDDGYELGGSSFRTCEKDGVWSGTKPTCTRGMFFLCMHAL